MAKNQASGDNHDSERYEYRVWGKRRKARKALKKLADSSSTEVMDDCYFLVDDPEWNAKVRDSTLKVKQLVGHKRGFERWTADWHTNAKRLDAPFDQLFDDLHLDRVQRGKRFSITKAVAKLDDDPAARPVFVKKCRTRYLIGSIRAEVTDITLTETGEELHTLAIEGADLDALVALRKRLGLKGLDNVPVHVAIDPEAD